MDKRFNLSPAERCPITVLDDVKLVRLPLSGQVVQKTIKKRSKVPAGGLLAVNSNPERGDLHAPFDAVIKEITSSYVEMEYEPLPPPQAKSAPEPEGGEGAKAAEAPPEPVAPVSLAGLDPAALCAALKSLGIATLPFTKPCDVYIINCINPEPGILYTEALLESQLPVIEAGFAMLRRLSPAQRFIFALPEGSAFTMEGASSFHVKPAYPLSLRKPLVRAVTGTEDAAEQVGFVRLHRLFKLGLAAQSGLPLTRTVVTALGKNYIVPLGTTLRTFFELAGLMPDEGDSIILGGLMRGSAMANLERGLGKHDEGVMLVRRNSMPDLEDNPCINCGACVEVCPMRLRPNMLSRYAEYRQYEGCRKEYLDVCIECGMCGYVCPACRPMQQYFRMAKFNLGIPSLQQAFR